MPASLADLIAGEMRTYLVDAGRENDCDKMKQNAVTYVCSFYVKGWG